MTKRNIFLILILLLFSNFTSAQKEEEENSRVELKRADILGINKFIAKDAKRFLGNVKLKQDDVWMFCDSVYMYPEKNNFKAFGNVHLIKGDSIEVFSDTLFHYGNLKKSMFRKNVIMIDKNIKLYTDSLDYDMKRNRAYYFNGGKIVDSASTLESKTGHYFTDREVFFFKDSVVVTTEDYQMFTDTLEYHSNSNKAFFRGPTTVVSDTNRLYAERGWYDTKKDIARIHQNARYSNNSQTLDCDTLFYNRNLEYGEAFSNVVLTSIEDSITLTSEYLFYNEANESSIATDSATLIQYSKADTTYLHADTIRSIMDTVGEGVRNIYAYYHTQMYSRNVQLRCDSIAFSFRDSVVRLFGKPVIWSDSSQMTAKKIHFRIVNNELENLFMKEDAIIIEERDSVHYNQIKGFEITAYLENHELQKANVDRRSQTIYYLEEENEISSMNKTRSRQMIVYFKDGQASRVTWISEPEGKIIPLKKLNQGNMFFSEFEWLDELRPKKREDIYIWKEYKPKD